LVAVGKFKKMLPMKRTTLLSLAGITGAIALVISQLAAADPSATSPSQESATDKSPPPAEDLQKSCGGDRFGDGRDRFHGHGRHWSHHRDHGGQNLARLLNLTEEQKQKVKEIMEASKPKIKAIRREQRAKVEAVMDDARKQIRPLLTPAQQKVFDEAQQLREDARKLKEDARALREEMGSVPSE
jgi:Spy/CpxP family protein refolding chaperone